MARHTGQRRQSVWQRVRDVYRRVVGQESGREAWATGILLVLAERRAQRLSVVRPDARGSHGGGGWS